MIDAKTTDREQVWDVAVRVFHWSLVVAFSVAYLSDDDSLLHIYSGYLVLGLVIFRIFWGGLGTRHARFSDFIYGPSEVMAYAKGLFSGNAKYYMGHNPLGGLMVLLLLTTLALTTYSGLKVYGLEGYGPLANTHGSYFIASAQASSPYEQDDEYSEDHENEQGHDNEAEEIWEEIHEFSANLMIVLIVLHIVGVAVSSKIHNENLVKAMITGYKEPTNASKVMNDGKE